MKHFSLIILLLVGLSSCWPSSVSLIDKGSMPEEWKTFSIRTLKNEAPNIPLNLPAKLTESLKDGIQNNTRLQLNSTTGKGEVQLEGAVISYSIMPVAMQVGDNSAKNRLTIAAKFTIFITEPKEEKIEMTSSRFIDYDSNSDISSIENTLLEEINAQIVQDVVNKLLSNW
jgi:hypothetical protein